jgi:putative membrane protein
MNAAFWINTVKVIHIVAMVSWFAGLFYLPRLFVYHTQAKLSEQKKIFCTMEYKLFYYIMTPAGLITLVSGHMLAEIKNIHAAWFTCKVFLALSLALYHMVCYKFLVDFAHDANTRSEKFFRFFNEYPTIILILCVILVVVQP